MDAKSGWRMLTFGIVESPTWGARFALVAKGA